MPPARLIQRRAPSTFCPTSFTATSRQKTDAVGPGRDIDQAVVVDERDQKHQHDADRQEADLLVVEAMELGLERRRPISSTLMTEISSTKPSSVQSKSRKEEKRCMG